MCFAVCLRAVKGYGNRQRGDAVSQMNSTAHKVRYPQLLITVLCMSSPIYSALCCAPLRPFVMQPIPTLALLPHTPTDYGLKISQSPNGPTPQPCIAFLYSGPLGLALVSPLGSMHCRPDCRHERKTSRAMLHVTLCSFCRHHPPLRSENILRTGIHESAS